MIEASKIIELANEAGKKLDKYKSSCHFCICGLNCTLTTANRAGMYFSIENGEKIHLTNNYFKEIDRAIAKHKKISLEGKGYIYIVSDGKYTKIGATTFNPIKRLNELQVGNVKKLSLIGSYHALRRIGTEKLVHEKYSLKHVRGEWFDLSGEDISEILNSRTQFSNNSEYQCLSSEDVIYIYDVVFVLNDSWGDYSSMIRIRFYRKIKSGQELAELERKYYENRYVSVSTFASDGVGYLRKNIFNDGMKI